MARKGLPIAALKTKADDFIRAGSLTKNQAEVMVKNIEAERGKQRIINDSADGEADADDRGRLSEQLTRAEMQKELDDRVEKMRAGAAGDGVTDQYRVARDTDRLCSWRGRHGIMDTALDGLHVRARASQVFEYIIGELEANRYLRLMVQASVRALAVF